MKKLLIIITLFMSSFFFLFTKDVKAYEYIKEVDFSLIEDVLSLKEKLDTFIETDTTYSDYYFIYSDMGTIEYYILPIDGSLSNFSTRTNGTFLYVYYSSYLKTGTNLSNINLNGGASTGIFYMYHEIEAQSKSIILYSNFDIKTTISGHTIIYSYQDFSYTENFVNGEKVSTLYDVYLKYQEHLGNKELVHQEEIDKLSGFYNVVIDKLSYLAEQIVSNYIYLSILVIFILIFVFMLIFRRFL